MNIFFVAAESSVKSFVLYFEDLTRNQKHEMGYLNTEKYIKHYSNLKDLRVVFIKTFMLNFVFLH